MKIGKNVVSYWNYMDLYELVEEFNNGTLDFRCQVLPQLEFRDGLYLYQEKESTEKVTIGDQTVELPSLKIGGDLFGYKDIKNNIVIEAQYGVCNEFHNGIAIVKMPTHEALAHNYYLDTIYLRGLNIWGAINTSGEKVIDYEYFYIQDYIKDGTTWAMTISMDDGQFRKEWVSIDKNGKIIAGPLQYNIDWIYNNDKFPIIAFDCILGVYYTFIDKKGSLLTDFDNDGIISLPLRENGERSELFKDVIMFSNDVAGAYGIYMDKEGWYYINKDFSVLSTVYDSIHAFSENMAAVKELQKYHSGKWGYIKKDPIDNTFIQAIPFSFSECGDFINGLAYFSNKGNAFNVEGYINTNGEVIWQTKRKKF